MNASFREAPTHRAARSVPEIRACIAARAEVQRYLVQARNTVDSKLRRLGCPETALTILIEWLERLELDLPDLAGLAGPLFRPDSDTEQFSDLWCLIESVEQNAGRQPETATEYLQAVARNPDAGKLAMFYWTHLHYPLR